MTVLARIETTAWKLEIVGELPELPAFISLPRDHRVAIGGAGDFSIYDRQVKKLVDVAPGTLVEPILFENRRYDFYLTTKSGAAQLKLPIAASMHHQLRDIAHHSINFRNDVGLTEFTIKSDVTGATLVRLEVFPTKIDYRVDYALMRDDVASTARNLVVSIQARTFGAAAAIPSVNPTLTEWLSLARRYFADFARSAKAIADNPHSRLVKTIEDVPTDRSRKVDERALARLLRKPVARSGAILPGKNIHLPEKVPGVRSGLTFDTAENRYVKALLLETKRNLQKIIKTVSTGDEDSDKTAAEKFFDAARPEARVMLSQVQLLLSASYLKDVETRPISRPSSMVVQQHPHYSSFERAARLLNGGLTVTGGPLQIGVKDIAALYEYWCFLKLTELLAEKFTLEQQNIVRINHTKVVITLKKGAQSAIRYREKVSGKELLLVYNRLFSRLPTIAQKPDNVIQLASEDNLYIFDAKYRLAFGNQYENQYGGIGPTVEDIATMHRYRDAIVMPDPRKKGAYTTGIVRGAAVLFPYPAETEYEKHAFYKSIESVEIGGLPFLPVATELVRKKLKEILENNGFL